MYHGTDAAVMIRESNAWMFKEVDSPLLGWEVCARKDIFYKEAGIALVADAANWRPSPRRPVRLLRTLIPRSITPWSHF
jgi:hypothetical protein